MNRIVLAMIGLVVATRVSAVECPPGTRNVNGKVEYEPRLMGSLDRVCPGGCPAQWCETLDVAGHSVKHGPFVSFHEGGEKNATGTYTYGKRMGHWVAWYPDGTKRLEGEWNEDQKTGHWTLWHQNGAREREGDYLDNEMHGPWIVYYENGQKQREGAYDHGKLSGHGSCTTRTAP